MLFLLSGCGSPPRPSIRVVDFIKEFDRAEMRPPGTFQVADRGRPSILAPSPGRIEWKLPLPRSGRFLAYVTADGTASVRFRVGVSDGRIYEQLTDVLVAPAQGWTAVSADLSAYAGRKLSLFYRPDEIAWRVTLSTDAVDGVAGRGAWGMPEVVAAPDDANEYRARRHRAVVAGSHHTGPK